MSSRKYANRKAPCPVVDLYKYDQRQQEQAAILRPHLSFVEAPGREMASADVHSTFEGHDTGSSPPAIVAEYVHPNLICDSPLAYE